MNGGSRLAILLAATFICAACGAAGREAVVDTDITVGLEASAGSTAAVIEARLLADPEGIPGYGPMGTFQVSRVWWQADRRTLQNGDVRPVTHLPVGATVDAFVRTGEGLAVGDDYILFLNHVFDVPQPSPWRAWLSLAGEGHHVVDSPHPVTVAEIEHVLLASERPDNKIVSALVEFTQEQVAMFETANGGGVPTIGPRTRALRETYSKHSNE